MNNINNSQAGHPNKHVGKSQNPMRVASRMEGGNGRSSNNSGKKSTKGK